MGTWGTRLYEDDVALDARGNFLEYRKNGMTTKEAEQAVIDETKNTFEGQPEWIDIKWLAICCAELETGTLSSRAKKKALEIIDSERQYDFWIEYGGSKADAGARSREMTLIKKYITNYDGKPVKRKSWVALQKAEDDYTKSLPGKSANNPGNEHVAVKNTKLDDVSWHDGDVNEDVDDDIATAYAAAHIACFMYWLITRGYYENSYAKVAKPIQKVRDGSMDVLEYMDKFTDYKLFSDNAVQALRTFVVDYYNTTEKISYSNDYTVTICSDKELYTFRPTTAEYNKMAAIIDSRYIDYQKAPFKSKPTNKKFWSTGNRFRKFTRFIGILVLIRLLFYLFS